ncbi:MAG TPA: cupin domain-containing protein [Gemmatimonadaceae bacterium]|nr:cupin domain-containing protein [Gemmatimonadaceae bacterium]
MRIDKNDVPVKVEAPGATARLRRGFGSADGYSTMSAEYFSLRAGTDIAPLLQGLKGDMCQAPHWGYMAEGAVTVTYSDGSREQVKRGDLFYLPPGHSVRVDQDAELVMFSPEHEHMEVLDHMKAKLGG